MVLVAEMRTSVDFDNTHVNYKEALERFPLDLGYVVRRPDEGKRGVRDMLLRQAAGERRWQRLQVLAYGLRIQRVSTYDTRRSAGLRRTSPKVAMGQAYGTTRSILLIIGTPSRGTLSVSEMPASSRRMGTRTPATMIWRRMAEHQGVHTILVVPVAADPSV